VTVSDVITRPQSQGHGLEGHDLQGHGQGLTFKAKAKANSIQGQAKAMTFKTKAHNPQGQNQG